MNFEETEVRRAFAEDEFVPFFQPLVELRTGELAGFELLARWNHRELGLIPPDSFIPIVEKLGLIDNLMRVILRKAFAVPALHGNTFGVAVNTSPIQLMDFKLPERFAAIAEEGGFSLDRLMIEITESALVEDLPRATRIAEELKALGCRLALDDFGTGYSSLNRLLALPFDELKVDRSFVSSMTCSCDSRKVVASVVGLGKNLGLKTTAEGVETKEQAGMLFQMGCDLGQGWLYGRPVPAGEVAGLISAAPRFFPPVCLPNLTNGNSVINLDALPGQRLAQLQAVYDGAPVALCLLDRNLRYVSLNQQLARMNGIPIEAHLGRTPAEIIPRFYRQAAPLFRRVLQGEAITGIEMRKPGADQSTGELTVIASYWPVRDEAGEVWGISVAMMDITEHKRTAEALRKTEDHHRKMVELTPHTSWVMNVEGEIAEVSPRWGAITGQRVEEALGTGWLKMLHPEDAALASGIIRSSMQNAQKIDLKFRVRQTSGEWLWMRSRGFPHFGPSGEVVCIYGVVEEIQGP